MSWWPCKSCEIKTFSEPITKLQSVLARTTRLCSATSVFVHSAKSSKTFFCCSGLAWVRCQDARASNHETTVPRRSCSSAILLKLFQLLVDVSHVIHLDIDLLLQPWSTGKGMG